MVFLDYDAITPPKRYYKETCFYIESHLIKFEHPEVCG